MGKIVYVLSNLSQDEENDSSTDNEEETELLTAYCKNGCQGACACPALMKNSELSLAMNSYLSLDGPEVPPPDHLLEVTANGSQSSLRRRSIQTLQHLKDKIHGNREGSNLNVSEKRGSQLNGSGSRGSGNPKGERRKSRFAEWRKKNFGGGHKRRSSEQVTQASTHQKTESPKSNRGNNREHS